MVSYVKSVTVDCADPLAQAHFWAAALGTSLEQGCSPERPRLQPPGWGGPVLWFQRVPEGKTAKNRMHLDLRAVGGDVEAEVARLVALGAREIGRDGDVVVLQDPEGNELCVEP